MKQRDILEECEKYCKGVILIHGGSTLNDTIILLITPIYLEQELNASSFMIGIALALIVGVYTFSNVAIPYIAESESKCFKYLSYDILIVIRLFSSIIVIIFLAITKSLTAFIVLSVLNSIFNVGFETSFSVLSLLLPEDKVSKYTILILVVHGADFLLAAVILSITMQFLTVPQLFYGCTVLYGLLFIFSLKYVLNKESQLISKQMELFDEDFYVEKKRRIAGNKSNKMRRRSSIAAEIALYFAAKSTLVNQSANDNENDEAKTTISESVNSKISSQEIVDDGIQIDDDEINVEIDEKRIDFPIFELKATHIFELESMNANRNYNGKSDIILSRDNWIVIYLSMSLDIAKSIATEIVTKWFTLYVVTRFNASISYANMFIAVAAFGTIFGIILFGYLKDNICKRLIYGDREKLNKREEIIITACCSTTNIFEAILVILWFDKIIDNLNYAWALMFICGWIAVGVTSTVSNLVIVGLNTEHLESKLLAIKSSFCTIANAFSSLIMGFLWTLSINWFLYMIIISSLMSTIISFLIIRFSLRM